MLKFLIILFSTSLLFCDCSRSRESSDNNFIPIGSVILNSQFSDDCAWSLLGEGGYKTGRLNGTLAWRVAENSRIKISGEILRQQLKYNFSTSQINQYMNQIAYGFDFQQFLDGRTIQALDFKGYGSFAPSKKIRERECSPTVTVLRNIAGSQAWGFSLGGVSLFGCRTKFTADINYDYVAYRRKFHADKIVQGFGGSVSLTRRLPGCVDVSLEGEFRRPFNYYGVKADWNPTLAWGIGVWAGYTQGRSRLPNASAAGIEIKYTFGCPLSEVCAENSPLWDFCDLKTWALTPAVYLPEVLAIAEEASVTRCQGPSSLPIPNQTFADGDFTDLSIYFSSVNGCLAFTAVGLPDGEDGNIVELFSDGVLEALNVSQPGVYTVTVSAADICGITSQTFLLTLIAD
jgi:hypothetical protein